MSATFNLASLKGAWALVTGASAGIGEEFCRQLAAAGVNVAMVARSQDKLESLGRDLHARHGVDFLAIGVDLGQAGGVAAVLERLRDAEIRVRLLVNNAAFGRWGAFSGGDVQQDLELYESMLNLNTVTPTLLCRALHADLRATAPSAVINVSSPAVYQPVPYMAAYAASKAALHSLSLALSEEWREDGILVQTLLPAPTRSGFDARAGAYESELGSDRDPPSVAVTHSLDALGAGEVVVSAAHGTYKQRFFGALFPPKFVVAKVAEMFRPKSS